ncbi:GspE/PulE family protein [Parvibium lacunae]|uniref:GspE/PulE family protein n=2 Tax=Parvibium lacunae TaxID=1888893 RepID=A0A368L230_9BURK|nr:GspE/PulE family protein [Parvibium lacunae]
MPALNLETLFQKRLDSVKQRIRATRHADDVMLEISADICRLFNADRLTLYIQDEGPSIVSRVKTGLNAFKDLRLPINDQSIAGYVAHHRRLVNIRDVYDSAELQRYSPNMHFLREVDRRTGYRTREMLVAPILDSNNAVLGVIQLINNRSGEAFGEMEEKGITQIAETLTQTLATTPQVTSKILNKYDALIKMQVLDAKTLQAASQEARVEGTNIEIILTENYGVTRAQLGQALSLFFDTPYEPYRSERRVPEVALRKLRREFLESTEWLPLSIEGESLTVMTLDPERLQSARTVDNIFQGYQIRYLVTTAVDFQATLDHYFGQSKPSNELSNLLSNLGEDSDYGTDHDTHVEELDAATDNELVKFVNKVIMDAYQMGASDIHIEPYPGKNNTEIRFRRDGGLLNYAEVPYHVRAPMVTRLKIMADLDISEKRKPQDGKIKFKKYGGLDIELRIATIPSAGGVEDIVMRILAAGEPIPLEQLGLTTHNRERLVDVVSKPYGLFFVCGPTGSGKTTTLHSILGHLNTPETKIWTAEDPVEITQKGLRQVQVNRKAGLDFATVMRAFLRADPDIIMVGEMRDAETTSIGIEASLTGHLVFATLHTNSAPESITRLLDMGMDPFNFGDALLGVLAQRLAKRLCSKCKEAYQPTPDDIKAFISEYADELRHTPAWQKDPNGEAKRLYERWVKEYGTDGKLTLYRAKGCSHCNDTGYRGRVGLHELMTATPALKKLIQERARVAEMFSTAVAEGMSTLKMDGMEKILMGLTDLKQVRAVCIK